MAEDVADGVVAYLHERRPWALLAPSTAFGREVAGRAAAATGAGLVGDAVPSPSTTGCWSRPSPPSLAHSWPTSPAASPMQMVTVRPGVLPAPAPAPAHR